MVECPYDGTLHDLFFGEEMSMALRLYTHGYDLYAPTESVVYHLWSRAHRPTTTTVSSVNVQRRQWSQRVVAQQLQGIGVGHQRTVQDWAQAVGLDLEQRLVLTNDQPAPQEPHDDSTFVPGSK